MGYIKTIPVDEKEGPVGPIYGMFHQMSLEVSGSLQAFSASSGLFAVYSGTLAYWRSHSTLSRDLLTCIRYAVATYLF